VIFISISISKNTQQLINLNSKHIMWQEASEDKYIKFPFLPTSFDNPIYDAEVKRSFDQPEEFWAE
jgi:hypothetical protein